MSRAKGRRYYTSNTQKLNMKKVIAFIVAIIVVIMFVISLKKLLTETKPKDIANLTAYFTVYDNNQWGVIDDKGNTIIPPSYEEMIIIPDKNKDVFICTYDVNLEEETYQTKVLNAEGEEILTQYHHVEPIENTDDSTVWYEEDILKYEENGQYGLINFEGKEILKPKYQNIYALKGIEKSIILEKDNKKGLFSNNAKEIIIHPQYEDITNVGESYESGYIVKNAENKYGIIGMDKKPILEVKYDEVKKVSGNNHYVVKENENLEVVDNTGKVLLNQGFDSIESVNPEGFTIIKEGKYGVISISGETIIPAEYEDLQYLFTNDYIAKKEGKYGIITSDNTNIVPYEYENMHYLKVADFIEAEKADYTTDILDNQFHKVLTSVIISEIDLEKGYMRIRKDNDYKYYNFKFEEKTSQELLPTNTLFLWKENGKYGYKNKNGEMIVDAIYDDAKEQNAYGYCAVKKDGLWGVLKSDGSVVMSPNVNLDDYLYIDFIAEWHRAKDLSLNIYTK